LEKIPAQRSIKVLHNKDEKNNLGKEESIIKNPISLLTIWEKKKRFSIIKKGSIITIRICKTPYPQRTFIPRNQKYKQITKSAQNLVCKRGSLAQPDEDSVKLLSFRPFKN
jgi:hypothetical protein